MGLKGRRKRSLHLIGGDFESPGRIGNNVDRRNWRGIMVGSSGQGIFSGDRAQEERAVRFCRRTVLKKDVDRGFRFCIMVGLSRGAEASPQNSGSASALFNNEIEIICAGICAGYFWTVVKDIRHDIRVNTKGPLFRKQVCRRQ